MFLKGRFGPTGFKPAFFFSSAPSASYSWLDAALCVGPALLLFLFLRHYPDPSGVNGYFYLKQTQSLSHLHQFYFKDYSIAFFFPAALATLGISNLLSFQLSIALTILALFLGLRRLLAKLRPGAPFWAIALPLVVSMPLLDFSVNFFKNLFALTLFIWALALSEKDKRWIAAILYILAFFSHKSILLIGAIFLSIQYLREKGYKGLFLLAGASTAILGIFVAVFPKGREFLLAIPGFLHFRPIGFFWIWSHIRQDVAFLILYLDLAIAIAVYIWKRAKLSRSLQTYGDSVLLLILLAIHPFQLLSADGPAYRLLILLPVLVFPLLASLLEKRTLAALVALQFLQLFRTFHEDLPEKLIPPWSHCASGVEAIEKFVRPADHITAQHGLEFFVDYMTGIRCRSFISDDSEIKQFRVAYVPSSLVNDTEGDQTIAKLKLTQICPDYVLLKEDDWRRIAALYLIPGNFRNPEDHRPEHLQDY